MQMTRTMGWALAALLVTAPAGAAGAGDATPADAVKSRNVAALREALKEPGAARQTDADGMTALHWAADLDDLVAAGLLVRAGADAAAANRYGVTPLHAAAVHGNAALIELLLDAGADVNTRLPEGESTLMTAARTGTVDAVRLLLDRGADVSAREDWKHQTALMWAAHEGNTDAVELLLEAGASLADRSRFGWTALLFAARQGRLDTVRTLVAAGADVNATLPDGTSALVTAVQSVNYETASALLALGADPNASGQGWTALHQVVWSRRPQRGQNNPGQKRQGDVGSIELARQLLAFGADINARQTKEPHSDMEGRNSLNRYGATPFLLAAKACDVPMMEVLLELGADPFLANEDGTTPLMVAAGVGIHSQGESPGTPEESARAVAILLDLGAPVNDVDKNGETALHGPSWRGSNEAVTLLVNAGAKLDVRNNRGWLPLTIAEGVYYNARVMMNKHTAQLLRDLMAERGLDTTDTEADLRGALRAEVVIDDHLDAENPSDVQRRLLENQRRIQAALEQLDETDDGRARDPR